jgi:hypothetical protein
VKLLAVGRDNRAHTFRAQQAVLQHLTLYGCAPAELLLGLLLGASSVAAEQHDLTAAGETRARAAAAATAQHQHQQQQVVL